VDVRCLNVGFKAKDEFAGLPIVTGLHTAEDPLRMGM
jgi:hypothetical protein